MTELSRLLLNWYEQEGRRLPWRRHPDPYAIWVSEIMLQQTRVKTVIPYFERWMERFPTIFDLAQADEQEVLAAWEGLGYYRRARYLHQAAKILVSQYNGQLPCDSALLRKLPGIGRYTASALAAILCHLDEPSIDGNVRRVLSRIYNLTDPVDTAVGERFLWEKARENLPAGRAADYNQALMDLGALLCTPRLPRCEACPVRSLCRAREAGVQEERPVRGAKRSVPHYTVVAAIIWHQGKYLLARRPERGLLGGMWEFPGGKVQSGETLEAALQREIREELGCQVKVGASQGVYRHAYTHCRITLHAFLCELIEGRPYPLEVDEVVWVTEEEFDHYPMGKVDRQVARYLAARKETLQSG